MIVGIDHVQLAMPAGREDVAREFYEGLLGIPEVPKPPALAKRGGAWFESGPVKIHVGVESEFRAAKKAHPACSSATCASWSSGFVTRALRSSEMSPQPVTTVCMSMTRLGTALSPGAPSMRDLFSNRAVPVLRNTMLQRTGFARR
jgi:hypothetical protein